ncbi:MAG: sulfoxide reductase heme-binding subunit YedZ [Saprospiraceae bacterium]|jgi:sulfoxide reductase heme-binding subunit YedZ
MLAFGATAIHLCFRNSLSFWVMMNRPFFGISFAILHLLHLAFLILLQQVFHPVFTLANSSALLAGGVAYFFIVLMLLTSFSPFKGMLSKSNWKRLLLQFINTSQLYLLIFPLFCVVHQSKYQQFSFFTP